MKFEDTQVFNFEGAIRGMRNPLDSWAKSDSDWSINKIGEADLNLCQRLISAGTEHCKFLRQIFVTVDITAPRFWWSEFDTYKVGTAANSCSTMHKIGAYKFTIDMFDCDDSDAQYINSLLPVLNMLREQYNSTKSNQDIITLKRMLPESFLQKRTVTMNYAVLRAMIRQRQHHRLHHWATDFINWCKSLPYAEELLFFNN